MKIVYFKEGKKKMKGKKKKILVLCGMAALLVITGVLNFTLNKKVETEQAQSNNTTVIAASFFDTYRTDRTASRDSQIELLNEIIESAYSTAQEKSNATLSKTELIQRMETELVLEGLIKAKGFEDAVVTIGANYYNVIVKNSENLNAESVAQILSVVTSETGVKATNVKIIPMQ